MKVDLIGANQVDADEITAGLAHHPPAGWIVEEYASYDPLQLTIDRQRILSYYRARGFYDARLKDVIVELNGEHFGDENGVAISFLVHEGQPFAVSRIHIAGAPEGELNEDTLLDEIAFKPGDIFVYSAYEAAKEQLTSRLVNAGYAHAEVHGQVEVYAREATVAVTLEVDAGPIVRFGTVQIDGGPVPEDAIRNRLAFVPGQVFDPALLSLTESRIHELAMVNAVTFYLPQEERTAVMDVGITVRSGPKNELQVGAGFARQTPNYQLRFRAGYVRRNLFDPRVRLATEIRPAVIYRPHRDRFAFGIDGALTVTREDLFAARLTGQAQVQYGLLQYEAYATLGPAIKLAVDRPWLDDRLQLSVAANLKALGFPRVDPVIPRQRYSFFGLPPCNKDCIDSGRPGGLTLLYLEPAIVFDGRDDPSDPKEGIFARLRLELGAAVSAPSTFWIRMTPEARGYATLGTDRLVLAGRARIGAKLLPGAPLPATQRYFGGGAESQRGFAIRQLSPFYGAGDEAVPIGGEALFELSAELRIRMIQLFGMWVGAVGFVDAADVGRNFSELAWLRPHVAAGGGLRVFTPIGPIRFDVGYRLNRVAPGIEPGGGDRIAYHLSLGEAF